MPPFFFPSTERSRIEHYKAVADAAGDLPFFVYNLPQLTQVETVPALMEKFVREIPTLKGLKHSAPNFADIRVFADMGLTCFSGNGAFPLPALDMGAVGTIDAPLRSRRGTTQSCLARGRAGTWLERSRYRTACASTWTWSGCSTPWRRVQGGSVQRGSASTAAARSRR